MAAGIQADVTLRQYGGDIVLESVRMDAARFLSIVEHLPPHIAGSVIGWKKIGQSKDEQRGITR